MGKPLPGDDYWYTIKLDDGREAKGHFSLKGNKITPICSFRRRRNHINHLIL